MNLFETVLDIIYPQKCMFCKSLLTLSDMPEKCYCKKCCNKMKTIGKNICTKCGVPLEEDEMLCRFCKENTHKFDRGFSVFEYDDFVKTAIYAFKYGGRKENGKVFGRLMAEQMERYGVCGFDLIVPVPLHKRRQRKRGYNQSKILACEVSGQTGAPACDILLRIKETSPQSKLNYSGRKNNIKGAIALRPQSNGLIEEKTVLLVDDIYTTGSTADECSYILKMNGVKEVIVFTVAIVAD